MKPEIHHLKTWPEFFEASMAGLKPFEVRKNDRDFKVGDILILQEYYLRENPEMTQAERQMGGFDEALRNFYKGKPGKYTGRQLARTVTYILKGPLFGLEEGYIIMGVK